MAASTRNRAPNARSLADDVAALLDYYAVPVPASVIRRVVGAVRGQGEVTNERLGRLMAYERQALLRGRSTPRFCFAIGPDAIASRPRAWARAGWRLNRRILTEDSQQSWRAQLALKSIESILAGDATTRAALGQLALELAASVLGPVGADPPSSQSDWRELAQRLSTPRGANDITAPTREQTVAEAALDVREDLSPAELYFGRREDARPDERSSGAGPAFVSGGGGFEFEDLIGAWASASLLAGGSPLGVEFGVPGSIRFQGSSIGRTLDDILIQGSTEGIGEWTASVKSFDMLRGGRLNSDFVARAWQHILDGGFDRQRDWVGFVSGHVSDGNWTALHDLIIDARSDTTEGLAARIGAKTFNRAHRSLWESALCPSDLAASHGIEVALSPALLLARLLPVRLDLLRAGSQAVVQAEDWCERALVPGQSVGARELWAALCQLVGSVRPTGGSVDFQALADRLGRRFAFALRPDVTPDWQQLARHAATALHLVRDRLGADLQLPRATAWQALADAPSDATVIYLSGPSGCGKTALAKRWLEAHEGQRLWLSDQDLTAGPEGLARQLGLRLALPDLLRLTPRPTYIVLDGLDRSFSSASFAAAGQLAELASTSEGSVRILITCQQMELARIVRHMLEHGAPSQAASVLIRDLDEDDVRLVLQSRTELQRTAIAGRLVGVLARPKLLDLVLRASDAATSDLLGDLRDEAAVAELWWSHLARGTAARTERGEFLLGLAERQADQLGALTPAGDLGTLATYVAAADPLRQDGILNESEDHYSFAHDLFGDWSRYQRLKALGPAAPNFLVGKGQLPPWHRAVRLHALSLLRNEGIDAWASERRLLVEANEPLVSDLYLDAAAFADNAPEVLAAVWPVLLADGGDLLRRLLNRFLHVATIPDPRGALIFAGVISELEPYFSATARLPLWPVWLPMLDHLHRNAEEAIRAAPSEIAAVAELWLRSSEPGWPGRAQAAEIALALGGFLVEHQRTGWYDREAKLWRAVLAAGGERPAQLLELCEPILVDDERVSRTAARAGPRSHHVDIEQVRTAVLEGDALVPLIKADPQRAGQLLLWAVIEPPRRSMSLLDYEGLGITNAPHWFSPVPERGPFLAFLTIAPKEAVAVIVRMVTHATDCRERYPPRYAEQPNDGVEMILDGEPVDLLGAQDMLQWHRGDGRVPPVLASALMAIECHLYRRIDAGNDVTETLLQLLDARSVAVAGLLLDVACYEPQLLRGPLAPLATSAALLLGDRLYKAEPHQYLTMGAMVDHGFTQRIVQWHGLKHRERTLEQFVMAYALSGEALVDELAAGRARWAETDGERWRWLLAQTDPANYRTVSVDASRQAWQYEAPAELTAEIERDRLGLDDQTFWLTAPYRIRQWIDEGPTPSPEEAEHFWQQIQERLQHETPKDLIADGVRTRADLQCGVAALYVLRAPAWLASHPGEQRWCREALLAPFVDPPAPAPFDSSGDISEDRWDVFCADAIPVLWAASPQDWELRSAAVRLAVNRHELTVRKLYAGVARQPALETDLRRLEHVSMHWARFLAWRHQRRHRLDNRIHFPDQSPTPEEMPDLDRPTRAILDAFVDGTVAPETPSLTDFVAATPDGIVGRVVRRRNRFAHALDVDYLLSARHHLLDMSPDLPDLERNRRLAFATQLAGKIAERLTVGPEETTKLRGQPWKHERVALGRLAAMTARAPRDQAKSIWEPILSAGRPAHRWVADFLQDLWRTSLADPEVPENFVSLVKELIEFATRCESWSTGRHSEDVDLALVGLSRFGNTKIDERHAAVITALQPEWGTWIRQRLNSARIARCLARFLGEPVAASVIPGGLLWLAERESSDAHPDDDLDEAIGELLVKLSARDPAFLRANHDAAGNARALLGALAARQRPIALELASRLGSA
ncbi:MAG: hypothetical protein ACLP8S_12290 [Solirubrobacteraceae bacterium]